MNTTSEYAMDVNSRLPWLSFIVMGVIAALSYFLLNLIQQRRFYKDMV